VARMSQSFEVVNDPRVDVSQEDLERQLEALLAIRDKISDAHQAVITIRSVKTQLDAWSARSDLGEEARAAAAAINETLSEIEGELIRPGKHEDMFGGQTPARLNEKLASLISVIASADAPPTEQSLRLSARYSGEIDAQLERFEEVLAGELEDFNALMATAELPAVEVAASGD
jgi:hypothetical protein